MVDATNRCKGCENFSAYKMDWKTVKLVVPTDFDILEAMSNGKRQTAPNLAEILDRESKYMNNRLAELAGGGFVKKVGPAERSGMYTITDRGRIALEHRAEYTHESAQEFAKLVDEKLEQEDDTGE